MSRIRLANLADAEGLVRIHNAVAEDLTAKLGHGYWSRLRSIRRQREKIVASDGKAESRNIYVFEERHEVLATTILSTRRVPFWRKAMWREPDAPAVCVFDLAVLPDLQGQGLGRIMMEFAEKDARKRGVPYVRLDAFSQNPYSTAFYEHLGYDNRGEIVVNGVGLVLYEKNVEL